jgi:hypothetical protein
MPNFQNNHFPLVRRQGGQAVHRRPFVFGFRGMLLKPTERFKLTRQTTPEAAPIIACPIAKTANAEMFWLVRRFRSFQQGGERFVQNVFRL